MLTTDDLARLRRAIEQAEHKPGEWATSGLAMGVAVKAGTESLSAGTGAIALTVQEGQRVGAFPYKRDGWLAVEAVNALPELLRVYEAVLAAPEGEVLRPCPDTGYQRVDGTTTADDDRIENWRGRIVRLVPRGLAMNNLRVTTLWGNIAKIVAAGVAASLAWGGLTMLAHWCNPVLIVPMLALAPLVGCASVLIATCWWDTHAIRVTARGGEGD